jgi:hypothetical protein
MQRLLPHPASFDLFQYCCFHKAIERFFHCIIMFTMHRVISIAERIFQPPGCFRFKSLERIRRKILLLFRKNTTRHKMMSVGRGIFCTKYSTIDHLVG